MNNSSAHERSICGAKTRNGTPCQRAPRRNGRCNLHGGKSLRGVNSPTFIDGRYSKYLPANLAERWGDARNDPELLSLHDEIRLIDVLLKGNLEKLDTQESGEAWALVRKAIEKLELSLDREDYGGMRAAVNAMLDVVDTRIAHYATEREIRDKVDQRRKLVETAQRIELQGERAVSVTELGVFMGALMAGIMQHISAPTEQQAMVDYIDALLNRSTPNMVTIEG